MRFKENDNVAAVIERDVSDNKFPVVCNEVYKRKDSQ